MNGIPHWLIIFHDLTDSIGETEMFSRKAYSNFIMDSMEFKENISKMNVSINDLAKIKRQLSEDKKFDSVIS